MEPTFVELPEMKIVGLGTGFISAMSPDKNNKKKIPDLWHEFVGRENEIGHRKGKVGFGLVEFIPAEQKGHKDEMFYVAGVGVEDFDAVPSDMLRRVIPAGRYAKFTHKGKLDQLEKTMELIYRGWAATSGVKLRPGAHIEWYDGRFNPGSEESEFDILLPV